MNERKKDFFLCLFGGWFGLHRFYRKEIGLGILYLLTIGLFLVGWITDTIRLSRIALLPPEKLAERDKIAAEKKAFRQERRQQAIAKYKEDQQKERDRLEQLKKEHIPYCPHCHSTSITYIEHRKKLSIGRAVVGGIVAGEAGAVLGGLTSKKVKGEVKCLNCGYTWKI